MLSVPIRIKTLTDICRNLTALIPCCTNTSFLLTDTKQILTEIQTGAECYFYWVLFSRVMANKYLTVVLHQMIDIRFGAILL